VWREGEQRTALAIAQRLGLDEVVGRLLAARGVGIEAAADFLEPTLRALLPDPSLLVDMDAAAERLARAVAAGETVGIFGDYDVDGACSAALLAIVLEGLGCAVHTHVPDRILEGYGPNLAALEGLVARGATLVVCVDCGTAAAEVLEALRGADVVVLDHHTAEGPTPRVVATVNPNRLDCPSGQRMLCATAVAFLTAVALVRALRRAGHFEGREPPDLMALLDLVALATVCDVMPLVGVNRALVAQGVRVLQRRARPGLAALLEVAQVRDPVGAMALGWALGPRINAGGRISDSGMGLRLLLSRDMVDARQIAATLDGVNRQRQQVEAGVLDLALAQAAAQLEAGHAAVLVGGPDWHPGVVGIVAGRIKERFNRPALVAGIADGVAKGSGRSVPGIDLGRAVIAARQHGLLATGGGHPMAAGFSLPEGRLAEFHAFLDERLAAAASLPRAADLVVEGTATVAGCGLELAQALARLAPFGNGNEEPVLALPRCRVVRADRIGKDGGTIRAFLEGEGGGPRLKGVMFRAKDGPLAEVLLSRAGTPVHVAGHLRAEEWNGSVTPGFAISDLAAP
jgi:single-stranded-DNA-specific exonuclease